MTSKFFYSLTLFITSLIAQNGFARGYQLHDYDTNLNFKTISATMDRLGVPSEKHELWISKRNQIGSQIIARRLYNFGCKSSTRWGASECGFDFQGKRVRIQKKDSDLLNVVAYIKRVLKNDHKDSRNWNGSLVCTGIYEIIVPRYKYYDAPDESCSWIDGNKGQ